MQARLIQPGKSNLGPVPLATCDPNGGEPTCDVCGNGQNENHFSSFLFFVTGLCWQILFQNQNKALTLCVICVRYGGY